MWDVGCGMWDVGCGMWGIESRVSFGLADKLLHPWLKRAVDLISRNALESGFKPQTVG